jgi:uncharacterized protein DUF6766
MRRFLYENGLSLVMFSLFVMSLAGQSLAGWIVYNNELQEHHRSEIGYAAYLASSHFAEAVFENWESEFLQTGILVVFTVFLRQKGSSESHPLEYDATDSTPSSRRKHAPWPVRRGGWILKVYEWSLSLALFLLFILSFVLHALSGTTHFNERQVAHGSETVSFAEYWFTSQFWLESFQNWQSEFLSVAALVVLSIFLRQKGSPQSKPVDHPHAQTGT